MKKGRKHTGGIRGGMPMHHGSSGKGGRDPHASKKFHGNNAAFGMHHGMSPPDGYGGGEMESGGEGMANNIGTGGSDSGGIPADQGGGCSDSDDQY